MALSFLQSAASTTDTTTYTFSDQNVGTAAADRYIVVAFVCRKVGGSTTVAVTVEGNSATLVAEQWNTSSNATYAGLYIVALPSGTDADVVVTLGAGAVRAGIAMWRLDALSSATASDTDISTAAAPTGTIDVPVDGCAVGIAVSAANTATTTWSGITETSHDQVEAAMTFTSASDEFPSGSSGLVITCNFGSSSVPAGAFAAWEFGAAPPAAGGSVMFPPNVSGTGRGGVFPGNRVH